MGKNAKYLILAAVLIIASFLRLYQFTATPPGLYPDEAADGNNALEVVHTGHLESFYPEDNGREGLYINLVAFLIKATNLVHEPWVVRLPAAISGILTVLGIYFFAAELFGTEIGLLSAFLLATSFWHINFSRIGFRAIMAPMLLTWSLYFLIKGFKKLESGVSFSRATAMHIIGGILFGLGMYTYIAYRVSPALVLLVFAFYWFSARKKKWLKNFFHSAAHFVFFSVIVALPLGYYFLTHPGSFFGRTSQISVSNSGSPIRDLVWNTVKTLAMFNVHGDWNWRHNIIGAPEIFWPVGLLFILGLIIGIKSVINPKSEARSSKQIQNSNTRNDMGFGNSGLDHSDLFRISNFGFVLSFLWFFLAMLPVVISDEGIPHALRSILMIIPAMIFAAIGGRALYNRLGKYMRASWLKPMTILFLVLLIGNAYVGYFIVWAKNPNVRGAFNTDYVALGRALNALPAATPKYVIVEAGGVPIRGIPTPAQTVMFITDTFRSEEQVTKNIHYVLPQNIGAIPAGSLQFELR